MADEAGDAIDRPDQDHVEVAARQLLHGNDHLPDRIGGAAADEKGDEDHGDRYRENADFDVERGCRGCGSAGRCGLLMGCGSNN